MVWDVGAHSGFTLDPAVLRLPFRLGTEVLRALSQDWKRTGERPSAAQHLLPHHDWLRAAAPLCVSASSHREVSNPAHSGARRDRQGVRGCEGVNETICPSPGHKSCMSTGGWVLKTASLPSVVE